MKILTRLSHEEEIYTRQLAALHFPGSLEKSVNSCFWKMERTSVGRVNSFCLKTGCWPNTKIDPTGHSCSPILRRMFLLN